MMRVGALICAIAVGAFHGCVETIETPSASLQTVFNYDEHKPYTLPGSNTLSGQGFLRQKGGDVVTCAGSYVYLMPATEFFTEMLGYLKQGVRPVVNPQIDPAYRPMLKVGQCNAQGNFTFGDLPDGSWYVITEVKWEVTVYGVPEGQGSGLVRQVTTQGGKVTETLLTDQDAVGGEMRTPAL